MTSVGTGYDLAASTYSPDGRLFQVEYAQKAVDSSGTTLGIKCTDGIILALEKPITTRLQRPGFNRRIAQVAPKAIMVGAGLEADHHCLVGKAREEAVEWRERVGEECPMETVYLAERMALFVQQHTLYSSVRPFGVSTLIGGVCPQPGLFMVEPTGRVHGFKAIAVGRGRQHARTELEKSLNEVTIEEGVKEAVRILVVGRQEDPSARERQVEIEVAVMRCDGRVEHLQQDAIRAMAKQALDAHNAAMDFEEI